MMNIVRRPRCFMDLCYTGGDEAEGRVVFELYTDKAPITTKNFRCLCTGERGNNQITGVPLHYKGSRFTAAIKGCPITGGKIIGTGEQCRSNVFECPT